MKFAEFGFHPDVATGIVKSGYTEPTPIQQQAIPAVMEGNDVMGLAQTGTGKTAAFLLPLLHRLMKGERRKVRALVLAPTRELAEQIREAADMLGRDTRLKCAAIYGGVNVNRQIEQLKRGVEIVVACPGRLLDHLSQRTIDLSGVETLILDEADQMFDMGFLPDIRRILKQLPQKRQTLLFSATMPDEIRGLAGETLRNPVTVQVGRTAPPVTVNHVLYPVPQHLKAPLLLELLEKTDTGSVLVFTRTKHRAKRLGEQLVKAGHKAASIQGNLSQNRRQEALDGFRDGSYRILAATDIAARGIDVSGVSHVVNYDIPDTAETYIHRIGRTGRAACTGDAFTFVAPDDAAMVRSIERLLGSTIERRTLEGFDYSAPAPEPLPDRGQGRPQQRRPQPKSEGKKKGAAPAAAPPKGKRPVRSRTRQGGRG